jgi:hypothetical protein
MIDPTVFPYDVLLSLERDADVLFLVTTGLGWKGGPVTWRKLAEWLVAHSEVPLNDCRDLPEHVSAFVQDHR